MNPPPPPAARKRPQIQNSSSQLLEDGENNSLFGLLGKKCFTLATGVVQVYLAKNPSNQWQKQCTGACCFVKDNPKRSYFIRVYNIKSGSMLWEQEMYTQFKCLAPRPYFLTFETDNCRAALNFASEKEGVKFKQVVEEKARQRQDKRQAKQNRTASTRNAPLPAPPTSQSGPAVQHHHHHHHQQQQHVSHSPSTPLPPTPASNTPKTTLSKESKKSTKKKKKAKLTKADISMPSGFQHVNHVGFDPNKGLDLDAMAPEMKDLMQSAGITESQMQDKETVDFIYDFIEKRGGMEAVKQDKQARSNRAAPPPPPGRPGGHSAPPLPPSRPGGASLSSPRPPPPQRSNRAPPPPNRSSSGQARKSPRPPPPPSSRTRPPPPSPVTSPSSGAPPPPPPPPPPVADNIPAPPPPPPVGSGNLMSQIQQGTDLKTAGSRPPPAAAPAPSGRDALLEAIRRGKELKTVSNDPSAEKPVPESDGGGGGGGLADALADALRKREQVIQNDSDSDEENDDDDDEWSD